MWNGQECFQECSGICVGYLWNVWECFQECSGICVGYLWNVQGCFQECLGTWNFMPLLVHILKSCGHCHQACHTRSSHPHSQEQSAKGFTMPKICWKNPQILGPSILHYLVLNNCIWTGSKAPLVMVFFLLSPFAGTIHIWDLLPQNLLEQSTDTGSFHHLVFLGWNMDFSIHRINPWYFWVILLAIIIIWPHLPLPQLQQPLSGSLLTLVLTWFTGCRLVVIDLYTYFMQCLTKKTGYVYCVSITKTNTSLHA